MKTLLPFLRIKTSQNELKEIYLTKTRYTIGRLPEYNDIVLPEEEGVITRVDHCVLERDVDGWWLTDKSTNGTIIERQGQQVQLQDLSERKTQISSKDIIRIHHFEIQFFDPNQTTPVNRKSGNSQANSVFIFNLSQQTLYKLHQGQRIAIELRPQVCKMLRFMAKTNLANQNQHTLCTYNDLISAIWEEDQVKYDRTPQDINGLAREIRRLFQKHGGQEAWLETKKTDGYILKINCEP